MFQLTCVFSSQCIFLVHFAGVCQLENAVYCVVSELTTEYLVKRELDCVYGLLTDENRLICEICEQTGLRVGDVLSLKPAQISRQFWITEQKTGKRKRVNLSEDLLCRLRAQAGEYWVFPGRCDKTRHRTRQAVWADLKRAARAYRLPQNVGVHSLRKIYAVEQFERKNGDLKRVQKMMNHSSQAVTLLYVMALESYRRKYVDGKRRKKRR